MIDQIDEDWDEVSDEELETAGLVALGGIIPTLPNTYCFACPSDPLRRYSGIGVVDKLCISRPK